VIIIVALVTLAASIVFNFLFGTNGIWLGIMLGGLLAWATSR